MSEAKEYQFASVCVNPTWVSISGAAISRNAGAEICTVIGFPLGATTTAVKQFETMNAIENGATEIDMVINIAALKEKDDELVENDIRAVVECSKRKSI